MTELATIRTELAHRSSGGVDVTLLWVHGGERDCDEEVIVCVWDSREGAYFEILGEPSRALDIYYHPFAHRDFSTVDSATLGSLPDARANESMGPSSGPFLMRSALSRTVARRARVCEAFGGPGG